MMCRNKKGNKIASSSDSFHFLIKEGWRKKWGRFFFLLENEADRR